MPDEKLIRKFERTKWYKDPAMVGRPVWVRDEDNELWDVELFRAYDKDAEFPFYTNFDHYKQAKPVKPEECYQGNNND